MDPIIPSTTDAVNPGVPQDLVEELRALPKRLGFRTPDHFLWAFRIVHHRENPHLKMTPHKLDALVRLTRKGFGRHTIAKQLGIAPQTVSNIRHKLGLNSRS